MSLHEALQRAEARYHLRCADQALGHYERSGIEAYLTLSSKHVCAYEAICDDLGRFV